jgi:antirestriction protein ArdC
LTRSCWELSFFVYLAHYLKLLKDDNRAIFTAAAKASEAVAYLKRLQPA